MTAINRAISIDWGGAEHHCLITFGIIERIEQDFNIIEFDFEIARGFADCDKVAAIFAHILNGNGAKVTVDEVGEAMFSDNNTEEKRLSTVKAMRDILRLIFPERKKKKLKQDEKPSEPLATYPWGEFYKRLVGMENISPHDYWNMTPTEAFLLIDLKEPEEKIGSFTVDEFEDLAKKYEELNG